MYYTSIVLRSRLDGASFGLNPQLSRKPRSYLRKNLPMEFIKFAALATVFSSRQTMELKAIEYSRVIFLTSVTRPAGQLFLPLAVKSLVDRYRFQQIPSAQELSENAFLFKMGEFRGVAIAELEIYPDGMIVTSRADSDLLDQFIEDLMGWAESDLGVVETGIPPHEKHYESALVISMELDSSKSLPFEQLICKTLSEYQQSYGLRPFQFQFGAISWAIDPTKYTGRGAVPFTLARRVNVPFDAGIYFSSAPLKTSDHLAVLQELEKVLS